MVREIHKLKESTSTYDPTSGSTSGFVSAFETVTSWVSTAFGSLFTFIVTLVSYGAQFVGYRWLGAYLSGGSWTFGDTYPGLLGYIKQYPSEAAFDRVDYGCALHDLFYAMTTRVRSSDYPRISRCIVRQQLINQQEGVKNNVPKAFQRVSGYFFEFLKAYGIEETTSEEDGYSKETFSCSNNPIEYAKENMKGPYLSYVGSDEQIKSMTEEEKKEYFDRFLRYTIIYMGDKYLLEYAIRSVFYEGRLHNPLIQLPISLSLIVIMWIKSLLMYYFSSFADFSFSIVLDGYLPFRSDKCANYGQMIKYLVKTKKSRRDIDESNDNTDIMVRNIKIWYTKEHKKDENGEIIIDTDKDEEYEKTFLNLEGYLKLVFYMINQSESMISQNHGNDKERKSSVLDIKDTKPVDMEHEYGKDIESCPEKDCHLICTHIVASNHCKGEHCGFDSDNISPNSVTGLVEELKICEIGKTQRKVMKEILTINSPKSEDRNEDRNEDENEDEKK